LERIKWLQHSNQTIFGGTVRTKDPSIETDNTDASVNETKPEETTTKVMEKHMDSIPMRPLLFLVEKMLQHCQYVIYATLT
jgi:hypothetical protein